MRIQGIRGDLLQGLLSAASESHPLEFAAILREAGGLIDEIDLVAGTISGRESALMDINMLPLDTHRIGSVHSHPNGSLEPSEADLLFFSFTGRYHLILGYPYDLHSWRCYTVDGRPYELEVVW
ncbi:MAG: Mov34/MPN/PAD-1 family protein [Methanomicrobiales archaeon]|nr:Mov34/MPN/PAD-1 family protein [Methanomicrobiales archaeon]